MANNCRRWIRSFLSSGRRTLAGGPIGIATPLLYLSKLWFGSHPLLRSYLTLTSVSYTSPGLSPAVEMFLDSGTFTILIPSNNIRVGKAWFACIAANLASLFDTHPTLCNLHHAIDDIAGRKSRGGVSRSGIHGPIPCSRRLLGHHE